MAELASNGPNSIEAGHEKRTLKRMPRRKTQKVEDTISEEEPKLKQVTILDPKTELSVQVISEIMKKKKNKKPSPDSVHGVPDRKSSSDKLNGMLIKDTHYRIGQQIGSGSFGLIHLVRNEKTGEKLAVKLEPHDGKHQQLALEWEVYKAMNQTSAAGVAKAHDLGTCGIYRTLVLDLLGPSLEQVFKMCKRSFSLHTTLLIAIQLMDRMECLHSHDIVHRDIKPENFLICKSPKRDNTIFVVDFGLSKFYIDPVNHQHIPMKQRCPVTGTPRYMSLNAHAGIEQSRRDDLEAVGYMLLYFLRGSLPWQGCRLSSPQARGKYIAAIKKDMPFEELCAGHPQEFVQYMGYVRNLGFYDTPKYNFLQTMFIALLEKEGYDRNAKMDWTNKVNLK